MDYSDLVRSGSEQVLRLAADQAQQRAAEQARLDQLAQEQRDAERREQVRDYAAELERRSLESRHERALNPVRVHGIEPSTYLFKQIAKAVYAAIDAGFPRHAIPEFVVGFDFFEKADRPQAPGHYSADAHEVQLNPLSVELKDPKRLFLDETPVGSGFYSTDEPFHVPLHELGHAAVFQISKAVDPHRPVDVPENFGEIARKVSRYAERGGLEEFLPEVFCRLVLGLPVDPEALQIYKEARGWLPPSISADVAPPVGFSEIRPVDGGYRVEFDELIDRVTATASSFVVTAVTHLQDRPPGQDDPVKIIPIKSVEYADDLRSAVVRFDAPETGPLGERLVYQIRCPGLRPAKEDPPKPVEKAATQQPITINLTLPPNAIRVEMPPVPAPVVNISPELKMPARQTKTRVRRDEKTGRILETESIEQHQE